MSTTEQVRQSRRDRYKEILDAIQSQGISSEDYLRHFKDMEDFERRLNLIESSYASAYESVLKVEQELGDYKVEWQNSRQNNS